MPRIQRSPLSRRKVMPRASQVDARSRNGTDLFRLHLAGYGYHGKSELAE